MKNKNKEDFWDRYLLKKWPYWCLTVSFLIFSLVCFIWGRKLHVFNENYIIQHEIFGTFGDFFGGVLGTFFALISALLVVGTFRHQRIVTLENQKQQETQRFNDMFFELIHLYQSEVKEFTSVRLKNINDGKTIQSITYTNKDFFDSEKRVLQRTYKFDSSYQRNQEKALELYMMFYTKHAEITSCYRTLYRIYDLVDNSPLEEKEKVNYLKILRAQLTESELFFLRYNAMSYYGRNFVKYINKYNILKHLPSFDLLELKDFWSGMTPIEKSGLNIVFSNTMKIIKRMLLKYDDYVFSPHDPNKVKYSYSIIKKEGRNDVLIKLTINNSYPNLINEYRGLDKLNYRKTQALLDCMLKEIFLYSNYCKFNSPSNMDFYSSPIYTDENGNIVIKSGVRTKNGRPLILDYFHLINK